MTTNLITLSNPRSAAAEAYRTLRTNLSLMKGGKPLHTILITTPSKDVDKAIAAANLAVAFAQGGHSTILVDADLHRPRQQTIWNTEGERGLTSMMREDAALSTPPLHQTSLEKLSVLPTGSLPDVPADMLSNPRINEVFGVLKARADYVLVEAPPVLVATDAALLASRVDGVILVVRAGSSRRDDVARASQALEQVGARILGSVLTNAPRERGANY
ncbi:MAG: CpsD/CapB family tyrosine-protein kinase [Chloroflexota bacterium]